MAHGLDEDVDPVDDQRGRRAAKASWLAEKTGPGSLVVNVGSTRLSVASTAIALSAAVLPSGLNDTVRCRSAPSSRQIPTMPLQVIITAAKTVSRASEDVSSPLDTTRLTISATSMTVTATASTSDPYGSPTRCATTSAWCTAASTAATSATAASATAHPGSSRPQAGTSTAIAAKGATVLALMGPPCLIRFG